MFPYTEKENEWLSTGKVPANKRRSRKSNRNRQRRVYEMAKRGPYWFVPFNKFYI